MKFGQPPKKDWRCSRELAGKFNPLSKTLNRLMVLDYVWGQLTGPKGRFWVLHAVKDDTLYVKVKVAVAKNELVARKKQFINELNKHFETPWIKKIEII